MDTCKDCVHYELCRYNTYQEAKYFGKDKEIYISIDNNISCRFYKEIVYAKWKLHRDGSGTCSHCKTTSRAVYDDDSWQNYCGHCGAIMSL